MTSKIATACTLLAFSVGISAAEPPEIPIESFFRPASFNAAKISPDGHYLAVVGPVNGDATRTQLDFVDLTTLQVVGNYGVSRNQKVSNLWWVTDDKIVYTTSVQEGYLDYPLSSYDLWIVGVNGNDVTNLDCGDVRDVIPGPTGKVIYECNSLLAEKEYVDGRARPTRWIGEASPIDYGSAYMDYNFNIRLAIGVNNKTFAPRLLYRDASGKPGGWQDISSFLAGERPFTEYRPLGLMAADGVFYFLGVTEAGTLGLYSVDPHALTKKLLFDDPRYDIDYGYSDLDVLFSDDHRQITAFRYDAETPKWAILDPTAPKTVVLEKLQKHFGNDAFSVTSTSNDNHYAVIFAWSDRDPGTYYLYDAKSDKLNPLFKRQPEIDANAMAMMKPIVFKASDGVSVHGYLTLPNGATGKLPVVVYPHGGPFGLRDTWGFDPVTQFLAYHGYAVLQIEYRGSGGYGTKFQEAGYKQWGGRMQDDLADGIRWAALQGTIDPDRVCIYGAGAGGYIAIEATIHAPDLYKCAIGYSGIYDLAEWRDSVSEIHNSFSIPFMKATLGDDEAAMKADSPVYHVDKIKAALLLAHGGADTFVPMKHADELREALDKAGKKYDWLYYPEEGHGFWKLEHRVELYTRMLRFLDNNIGPGSPSASSKEGPLSAGSSRN
jgi:dienelactone hydrolase